MKAYSMCSRGEGIECRVTERIQHNTLRWFGQVEIMPGSEMTRRMYMSMVEVVGTGR